MITYYTGDIIKLSFDSPTVIIHICNIVNAWGKGFVLSLSSRWKEPEKEFRKEKNPQLGQVQFVSTTEHDVVVANMFAQKFIRRSSLDGSAIDLLALANCLDKVVEFAQQNTSKIIAPKIGAGLAGEKWENIENILKKHEVNFNVYTL
jgi:O-acetyl-ADP-ribose deacetylase (regulator of RNase III)